MKGVPFSNKRYTKGVPFLKKWYIKGYGVGPRGGAFPYKTFLSPPPPSGVATVFNAVWVLLVSVHGGTEHAL